MSNFTKMRLVADDELQNRKEKQLRTYDPKIRTLTFLQSDIDSILNADHSVNPDEMYHLFLTAQQRYNAFKTQAGDILLPGVIKSLQTTPQVVVPPETIEEILIRQVPAASRGKAKQILAEINAHPDILTYDQNNIVYTDGYPQFGSNFKELFISLFKQPNAEPVALSSFLDSLSKLNVAEKQISNRKLNPFHINPPEEFQEVDMPNLSALPGPSFGRRSARLMEASDKPQSSSFSRGLGSLSSKPGPKSKKAKTNQDEYFSPSSSPRPPGSQAKYLHVGHSHI
jgi:hypothetical protein